MYIKDAVEEKKAPSMTSCSRYSAREVAGGWGEGLEEEIVPVSRCQIRTRIGFYFADVGRTSEGFLFFVVLPRWCNEMCTSLRSPTAVRWGDGGGWE